MFSKNSIASTKVLLMCLLFFISADAFGQISAGVKITDMPTATGRGKGGWIPIVIGGVNKKIRVDSIAALADSNFFRLRDTVLAGKLLYIDSSGGYPRINVDSLAIRAMILALSAGADSLTFSTKFRSDTSRNNLYALISTKLSSYTETDPKRVTSLAFTGTTTKTLTLTLADASTISGTFSDISGGGGASKYSTNGYGIFVDSTGNIYTISADTATIAKLRDAKLNSLTDSVAAHNIEIGANTTNIALKANIASPALTGVPSAPTASPGTTTTQLATTAFVTAAVASGGGAFTETVQEFTSSTSSTVTVTNSPIAGKAIMVYLNGVLFKASNLSVTGSAITISGVTRETDDVVSVKYSY